MTPLEYAVSQNHSDIVHFFITEAKMDSMKFSKVSSKLLRINMCWEVWLVLMGGASIVRNILD